MNGQPASKYVKTPEVDRLALHVHWADVRRRLQRRRTMRIAVAAVATMIVGGIVANFAIDTRAEILVAGGRVSADVELRSVELEEGSSLTVAPESAVSLAKAERSEVVVVVESGQITFDVVKRSNRSFVVQADGVEVRVVGTKFIVRRQGSDVDVEVLRGTVDVRDAGGSTRLERGGRWRRLPPAAAPSVQAALAEPELSGEPDEEGRAIDPEPQVRTEIVRPPKRSSRAQRHKPAEEHTGGGFGFGLPRTDEPIARIDLNVKRTPSDVFAAAMAARSAGDVRKAINGFQQVCERWPASAFAPMSAFEWGRLALESEDDPQQAARAFERAIELATSELLIEDALARLVEAYARFDKGACARTREEYVQRFPVGSHLRSVTKACSL